MGKFLAGSILVSALIAGVALYYLQVYAFYEDVQLADGEVAVAVTSLISGEPEAILTDSFQGIDADSSPLKYRACFTTPQSLAMMSETYVPFEGAVPIVAPDWFDCFDAAEVGETLENGAAMAFLGEKDIIWGFDRVVAVLPDGRGFVWHQINACGIEVFDGKPLPEGCPARPVTTNSESN